MKKFAIVLGIAFAILVVISNVNVFSYYAIDETVDSGIERVEKLDDIAADYANSVYGYNGKVAYAKVVGIVKDTNYDGCRVDVRFYNAYGDVIGYTAIASSTLYNFAS